MISRFITHLDIMLLEYETRLRRSKTPLHDKQDQHALENIETNLLAYFLKHARHVVDAAKRGDNGNNN